MLVGWLVGWLVDWLVGWFMVFNVIFNYISVISWRSALLVEETGEPREKHHKTKPYQTRNVKKNNKKHELKSNCFCVYFELLYVCFY